MRPIATDMWRVLSVSRSVGVCICDITTRYPAKMAGPIEMPFGMWGGVDPSNHVLDGGLDSPEENGQFWSGKGAVS